MKELLTDKGLRTLSPQDVDYKGFYEGNQAERDRAYHQGTTMAVSPLRRRIGGSTPKEAIRFWKNFYINSILL